MRMAGIHPLNPPPIQSQPPPTSFLRTSVRDLTVKRPDPRDPAGAGRGLTQRAL
jgi:hypothetical protein